MRREAIELDFVREFAHSGQQLGPSVSSEERRERIRCSILREQKEGLPYQNSGMTYAQIYRVAYNKSIETEKVIAKSAPVALPVADFMSEEDEEALELTSDTIG